MSVYVITPSSAFSSSSSLQASVSSILSSQSNCSSSIDDDCIPADDHHVAAAELSKAKVQMCSIGVQTESDAPSIDLTLPLWMVALPDLLPPTILNSFSALTNLLETGGSHLRQPFEPKLETSYVKGDFGGEEKVVEAYQSVVMTRQFERHSFEELRIADVALYPAEATNYGTDSLTSPASFSSFTQKSFGPSMPVVTPLNSFKEAPVPPIPSTTETQSNLAFPLYRDAIQVIMRYLNMDELISSMQLSKQWYQALKTAHSFGLTSRADPFAIARMPAYSVIARHVARVYHLCSAINSSYNLPFAHFSLFPHLRMLLPNLKHLEMSPVLRMDTYVFPPQVETIILIDGSPCNQLIQSIGQLKQLRELQLNSQNNEYWSLDFTPLIALPQLEGVALSANQRVEIKQIASLAKFIRHTRSIRKVSVSARNPHMNKVYVYLLEPTAEEPTFPLMESGNLTSIHFPNLNLDGQVLRALSHYPGLTQLSPESVHLLDTDLQLFAKFPNLTEFEFPASGDSAICKFLPNLLTLRIGPGKIDTKLLDECLSHLPRLTDLRIGVHTELASAAVALLAKYGLPNRLIKLELYRRSFSVSDLRDYILPLQQLKSLTLRGSISDPIRDELKAQLSSMPKMSACNIELFVQAKAFTNCGVEIKPATFTASEETPSQLVGVAPPQAMEAPSAGRVNEVTQSRGGFTLNHLGGGFGFGFGTDSNASHWFGPPRSSVAPQESINLFGPSTFGNFGSAAVAAELTSTATLSNPFAPTIATLAPTNTFTTDEHSSESGV